MYRVRGEDGLAEVGEGREREREREREKEREMCFI